MIASTGWIVDTSEQALQVRDKEPKRLEAEHRRGDASAWRFGRPHGGWQSEERCRVRNERSRPVPESLKQWLEETLVKLSKESDTAQAVRYALGLWEALVRHVDDGRLEIDNNAAERALRVVALGRGNYLFAGSDRGGERAAAIYSLLGAAKLNDVDPEAYLREVLSRIAEHPIQSAESTHAA
jgi:transposase